MPKQSKFTVFFDRDGVFNRHIGAVLKPEQLEIFSYAAEAMAKLDRADVQTSLATNQPWIGLGMLTQKRLARIHDKLQSNLQTLGRGLDHIEASAAPPGLGHRRRKPNCGMLEDGAKALGGVDKNRAVMVGDKWRDVLAARRFGIPAILLRTTKPYTQLVEGPDFVICDDLAEAVDEILSRL